MPALLGTSPIMKFNDADGTALASGTVETYITGTSTPKNTYSNGGGDNAATSFTLDSNGEAVRYFDLDVAYKLIVKDSSGNTIRTVDPYAPIPNGTVMYSDVNLNGFGIVSPSGTLTLSPGSGSVVLDGLFWPQADGAAGQVLRTNGANTLSWINHLTDLVYDTSPQLGGDLDTNSNFILFDTNHGIYDSTSNELLYFTRVNSAINFVSMTNATSSQGPIIAAGGTTNVDLNINAKGSGNVVMSGLSYPNSDGTSGQALITDGAGNLTIGDYTAAASQAQMEAATSSTVFASPSNLHYHPGAAKAWVVFDNAGTVLSSFNTTSVADNGTGDFTITWAVTFSSVNYMVCGSVENTGDLVFLHNDNPSTTTSTVYSWDISAGAKGETGIDTITAVAYGDLA